MHVMQWLNGRQKSARSRIGPLRTWGDDERQISSVFLVSLGGRLVSINSVEYFRTINNWAPCTWLLRRFRQSARYPLLRQQIFRLSVPITCRLRQKCRRFGAATF